MVTSERRVPSGAAVMQPSVTAALTRALFTEWARVGYGALSLEAVARRAGVGKAALYRRWHSKAEMVADRLTAIVLDLTAWPDTGSLAGDVTALLYDLRNLFRRPLVRRILPDLHAEVGRNPELTAGVDRLQRARRNAAAAMLARAIERGELHHDADLEIAIDFMAAPLYWHSIVFRQSTDDASLERLTAATLAALRALK
jgi:AcrR family transcriptional regulator